MIALRLEEIGLKVELKDRATTDRVAEFLNGSLVPMEGDAERLLEFIRVGLPTFTCHSIQHSLRLLDAVSRILSRDAVKSLSSVELFVLIAASFFHDAGMISGRANHHLNSGGFIESYFKTMGQLSDSSRLARYTSFVAECHGVSWSHMIKHELYEQQDTVSGQVLRPRILAILLRVGDLLDLDADRTPDFLLKTVLRQQLDEVALSHHLKHKRVSNRYYDEKQIVVSVEAATKEEHQLWSEWFRFLEQEIEKANTYVFVADLQNLHLPVPRLRICPSSGAKYNLLSLRFELDESGKLWDVISGSVYTGRFDFIREVLQNAVDASLLWIYLAPDASLPHRSPRCWQLQDYDPVVVLLLSAQRRKLLVADNGVGMNAWELQNFLFKVASSGARRQAPGRGFVFPSIASFGIGFISVLTRADRIVLETQSRLPEEGSSPRTRRVEVSIGSREAYVEEANSQVPGTKISLDLREELHVRDVLGYLREYFKYPSVPIICADIDQLRHLAGLQETIKACGSLSDSARASIEKLVIQSADVVNRFDRFDLRELGTSELVRKMSRIAKQLSSLRRARRDDQAEIRSLLSGTEFRPLLLTAKRFSVKLPAQPVLLNLVSQGSEGPDSFPVLDVTSVCGDAGHEKIGRLSILWVPVALLDWEKGIEWQSVHGFLLKDRSCERAVYSVGPRKALLTYDDYVSLSEVYEESLHWEEEKRQSWFSTAASEVVNLTEDDEVVNDPAGQRADAIRVGDDDIYVFLEMPHPIPPQQLSSGRADFTAMEYWSTRPMATGVQEQLADLDQLFDQLDNRVYQDGFLLPISAAQVVPLGACRAKLNLTAGARLELNVSRNVISEAPGHIDNWIEAVAVPIQKAVCSAVRRALTGLKCDRRLDIAAISGRSSTNRFSSLALDALGRSLEAAAEEAE